MNTEQTSETDYEKVSKEKLNNLRRVDLMVFVVLLAICAGWIWITFQIPFRSELTWPGMLPMVLLCLIIFLIVMTFFTTYIPNPGFRSNFMTLFRSSVKVLSNTGSPFYRGCWTILLLLGYRLALVYLPLILPPGYSYILATFTFIVLLVMTFRAARAWLALLTAALCTIALTIIFGHFYHVPLP